MKTKIKISKAQKEIWDWKEKALEKLNNLSTEEKRNYLSNYQVAFLDFFETVKSKTTAKTNSL